MVTQIGNITRRILRWRVPDVIDSIPFARDATGHLLVVTDDTNFTGRLVSDPSADHVVTEWSSPRAGVFPRHRHPFDETIRVLAGGIMDLETSRQYESGDTISIPRMTFHALSCDRGTRFVSFHTGGLGGMRVQEVGIS